MCLVSVAFRMNTEYPVVLAGNRDEYHARPSAAADWWDDHPDIVGGRDLQAGGTWLAASRTAHVAVVTNRPDLPPPDSQSLSRGALVVEALSPTSAGFDELPGRHNRYGGFSLLVANRERLTLFAGGNGSAFERRDLSRGICGISNTAIDDPWPKVGWLNDLIAATVNEKNPDTTALLDALSQQKPVPGASSHGIPATPFVAGSEYGTRCSTVVLIRSDGSGSLIERRFGPGATPVGETVCKWDPSM